MQFLAHPVLNQFYSPGDSTSLGLSAEVCDLWSILVLHADAARNTKFE